MQTLLQNDTWKTKQNKTNSAWSLNSTPSTPDFSLPQSLFFMRVGALAVCIQNTFNVLCQWRLGRVRHVWKIMVEYKTGMVLCTPKLQGMVFCVRQDGQITWEVHTPCVVPCDML